VQTGQQGRLARRERLSASGPPHGKFLAGLFESGTQSGDLLGLMPGDGLPVIAAFGEITDGDAKSLQRALLGGGTLLPGVPAAAKQPGETRWRALELRFEHGADYPGTLGHRFNLIFILPVHNQDTSLVSGVLGRRQSLFDLWGDTVNIAARLESHGKAGCVNLSLAAWERIRGFFEGENRSICELKGKPGLTEIVHLKPDTIKWLNA
jgi:hypothetical protein